MPAGIKDDALWQKAKSHIGSNGNGDYNWAEVMSHYKSLGGEADKAAEEACSAGTMGQLMRAGESWHEAAHQFVSLREAMLDAPGRRVKSILVTEGPGNQRDKNYYTERFINAAARAYEGARAYQNHASESEYRNRPEGDVRVLFGFYNDLKVEDVRDKQTGQTVKGVVGWLNFDESDAGRDAYAKACAQIDFSKIYPDSTEEYCGLSISGTGILEGTVEYQGSKWNRIVGVGQADSVDLVTRPARGGAFLALTESAGSGRHLPPKEQIIMKKLIAITAELTEAQKVLKTATEATREAAQAKVDGLMAKLAEAAKDPNADDENKEADDMAALKKLMPKGSEEADDVYEARIAKVKAAAKGKEAVATAAESFKDGSMSVDELRKKYPKTFEAVASRVRESEGSKNEDIKELKNELREASIKLLALQDKELATKLLTEAGVPVKFLSVGDLIGMTEAQMRREIERTKALLEESAGGRVHVPVDLKAPKGKESKLAESVNKILEAAGVSTQD